MPNTPSPRALTSALDAAAKNLLVDLLLAGVEEMPELSKLDSKVLTLTSDGRRFCVTITRLADTEGSKANA